MVKLNAYDTSTGHVQTLHTWATTHRGWSKAYRMMTRLVSQDRTTETAYYLTGV